ncbi:hypothetical protein ACFYZ4_37930 [Streptomyces sp. NPDC001513]|uniref:hypothetical protein n=1 Tax=Streptomyces sp. NPDC001513 TaxID=3364580 RepID=UPI003684B386
MTAGATAVENIAVDVGGGPVRFGTGLLRTTVHGGLWVREPGPLAPAGFHPLPAPLPATPRTPGVRLVYGEELPGGARAYRGLSGDESVAGHLLRHGPHPGLRPALHALGRALAALHTAPVPVPVPVPAGAPAPPTASRGWARLDAWLAGRAPEVWAAQAASVLRERLGAERWHRLRDWTAELAADPALVVSHGAPGLGSLVADPVSNPVSAAVSDPAADGPVELLVGEDVCLAPWYSDVGWAVGELTELAWQLGGDSEAWQGLVDAVEEGYGRPLGPLRPRLAALRIALHLHDYTAYVGWQPETVERFAGFLGYLTGFGGPTAPGDH